MAYEIVVKQEVAFKETLFDVHAPQIAKKSQAGQFVIVQTHEEGERIPLTLADWDTERGTITIVFQEIGKSTAHLATFEEGDEIYSVVGPLGKPSDVEELGTIVCVGGGVGIAAVHPIARANKEVGNHVISIIGARNKDLLIMEEQMALASSELIVTTDDGSYGFHGFPTQVLKDMLDAEKPIKRVIAVGPVPLMRFVGLTTEPYGVETIVSLNPIMVDGTGMCGGCRVSVGGKTYFACVDGPEFDAHQVDFEELVKRQRAYLTQEKASMEAFEQRHANGQRCYTPSQA